jgi:hypothetical protein
MLLMSITALTTSSVSAAPPISINFQDAATGVPGGFTGDTGAAYGVKGGETFGWVTQASLGNPGGATPFNAALNGRNRNQGGFTVQQNTFMHMQANGAGGTTTATAVAWEYATANGIYSVTVSAGDTQYIDSIHTLRVEGVTAINLFTPTNVTKLMQATVQVTVSDGKLTIDAIGGTNTKINYVTITPVADSDNDGVADSTDNCPAVPNPTQANNYGGAAGDACEDSDSDSFMDNVDACPTQSGIAPNGCPPGDADSDGITDNIDNCPAVYNPTQANTHGGAAGDACEDSDVDSYVDAIDACPTQFGGPPDGCPSPGYGMATWSSPDDRLNWGFGGLNAAIYSRIGEGGDPQLHVYCINDQGAGFFGMAISGADVNGFAAHPAHNTLVKTSPACNLSFYILSTGEYQINIGPDDEGKVTAMVFSGLGGGSAHFYNFEDHSGGVPGVPGQPSAANGIIPLDGCRVTTLDILNFRDAPSLNSTIKTMVPFDLTLDAINKSGEWFNVVFEDDNGWVHASFLKTFGSC